MKKMLIAALLVACGSTTASADPLMKYTYGDVAYQWTHVDADGLNDSNGLDAKLSAAVVDNFALEGGYNYANSGITGGNNNISQSTFRYGGAGWYTWCNGIDLVGRVGGSHVNQDVTGHDQSDNGVYTGVGVRYLITETLEGDFDALYDSVNSITNPKGGTWTYTGTLLQTVAENVALKGAVGIDADTNVFITAGVRLAM